MKIENKEVFISAETLRQTSTEDLQQMLKETKESLFHLQEQSSGVGVPQGKFECKRPHLMKGYRKLIARIETILRERR